MMQFTKSGLKMWLVATAGVFMALAYIPLVMAQQVLKQGDHQNHAQPSSKANSGASAANGSDSPKPLYPGQVMPDDQMPTPNSPAQQLPDHELHDPYDHIGPQLRQDFQRPDPRLPYGYRQYAPSFRDRYNSRYSHDRYDYGYSNSSHGGFDRRPMHSYDYGNSSYYRNPIDEPYRNDFREPYHDTYRAQYPDEQRDPNQPVHHEPYVDDHHGQYRHPNDAPYNRDREEAYRSGVDDGRRFEQFERSARLGLASYLQAMELGFTTFADGDYPQAVEAFILAARINQGDAACRIHAAQAHFALGQVEQSVAMLRRAIQLEPRILQLPLDIRTNYDHQDQFRAQLTTLESRILSEDATVDEMILLGYQYLFSGNAPHAAKPLYKAQSLQPKDPLIQQLLAKARLYAK